MLQIKTWVNNPSNGVTCEQFEAKLLQQGFTIHNTVPQYYQNDELRKIMYILNSPDHEKDSNSRRVI